MVRTFNVMQRANQSVHFEYLIVPTMYDRRTKASVQSLSYLQTHYKTQVWDDCIPIDTYFRESSVKRLPLPLMDASRRGAVAYYKLLRYLVERELERNPEKVTPQLAALLTDDEVV